MVSRMLTHLQETRQFTSPYAPEFVLIGARVSGPLVEHLGHPLYVMGKGQTEQIAQTRMCGEAAERASILAHRTNDSWVAQNGLTGAQTTIIPNQFFSAPFSVGTHGCASHNQFDTACKLAVNELWERRAVQDWWEQKSELRVLDKSHALYDEMQAFVSGARAGAIDQRTTQFGLIKGPYAADVAVAISHDQTMDQFALAFAAGAGVQGGLFRRAFEELLSVELETADLFRAHLDGDDIGKDTNRYVVRARQQALAQRLPSELETANPIAAHSAALQACTPLNDRLQSSLDLGCPVWLIDQTHDAIGVPTIRAVFENPDLHPFATYDKKAVTPL